MTATQSAATAIGLTFDCADAAGQARFWALALGYVASPPPQGWDSWDAYLTDHDVPPDEWDDGAAICDPAGAGPAITFLKVPEPKRAKNRLHLDLKVSGGQHINSNERTGKIEAKVSELVAAGATVQTRNIIRDQLHGVVMLDPEGNEFCIA